MVISAIWPLNYGTHPSPAPPFERVCSLLAALKATDGLWMIAEVFMGGNVFVLLMYGTMDRSEYDTAIHVCTSTRHHPLGDTNSSGVIKSDFFGLTHS